MRYTRDGGLSCIPRGCMPTMVPGLVVPGIPPPPTYPGNTMRLIVPSSHHGGQVVRASLCLSHNITGIRRASLCLSSSITEIRRASLCLSLPWENGGLYAPHAPPILPKSVAQHGAHPVRYTHREAYTQGGIDGYTYQHTQGGIYRRGTP